MSSINDEAKYTAGMVAQATEVLPSTLQLWVYKGYLPFPKTSGGQWRKFTVSDVAYVAALASIAGGKTGMDAFQASSALTAAIESQPGLWRNMVKIPFGYLTKNKFGCLGVAEFHGQVTSEFLLPEGAGEFLFEPTEGEISTGQGDDRPRPPRKASVYNIGHAIAVALRALPE